MAERTQRGLLRIDVLLPVLCQDCHASIHFCYACTFEFGEIKAQGYPGTERSVYRYLKTLKQAEVRASVNPARLRKYSANTAVWLFVGDPDTLNEVEREDLAAFCQASPALKCAYALIQDFRNMLRQRVLQAL